MRNPPQLIGRHGWLGWSLLLVVVALFAAPAQAFTPITESEDVLSSDPTIDQKHPVMAGFADGTYVIAWMQPPLVNGWADVYARRYDAGGVALGPEFQVGSTAYYGGSITIAPRADNGFVVAWNYGFYSVIARVYGADDLPISPEIHVFDAPPTDRRQYVGSVAVRSDGRFLVTWGNYVEPSCCTWEQDVYARFYDGLGNALGSEFLVNTYTPNVQGYSVAAVTTAGNFVIAWGDREQDGTFFSVFGRLFDGDGLPLTGEFAVNEQIQGLQIPSDIVATPNGGFAIAWRSDTATGAHVFMRSFDAAAQPLQSEFQVDLEDSGNHAGAQLSVRPDGTMLVTWSGDYGYGGPGAYGRVWGRFYDASMQPLTDPFQINGFEWDSKGPVAAFLPESGQTFHVAWGTSGPHNQDGSGLGMFVSHGCIGDGPDADLDGIGDECDPCNSAAAHSFDPAGRSAFRFINDLNGGDRYAFVGEFPIDSLAEWSAIAPESRFRIRVEGDRRRPVIDADLSSTGLWTKNGTSSKWTYRDKSAAIDGISNVRIQRVDGDQPVVRVKVAGKNGHYGIGADEALQTVTLTYGDGSSGECAHVGFLESECGFDGLGRGFACSR